MFELEPGEKIILEVRRHWFVFTVRAVAVLIMALLPLLVWALASGELRVLAAFASVVKGNLAAFFAFFYILWLLVLWVYLFLIWTDYYLDIWLITDRRIVDIEQKGMFHREISSFRLDNIQDITIDIAGIIATSLKFGNVHVQTAGAVMENFIIRSAHDPERIKRIIIDAQNKMIERQRAAPISGTE
ncbi:MAG: PH domain-containing protein [Candidatus Taylorbacteria bacterium]|nr:PH domain-containing protein [Candidatus Taylorbacteria bacterium]